MEAGLAKKTACKPEAGAEGLKVNPVIHLINLTKLLLNMDRQPAQTPSGDSMAVAFIYARFGVAISESTPYVPFRAYAQLFISN